MLAAIVFWTSRITLAIGMALLAVGCVESQTELDPGSRLPKWFSMPSGLHRSDLAVRLTSYSGRELDARMELIDRQGGIIATVVGRQCWHPAMEGKHVYGKGFTVDTRYTYVSVDGTIEVLEHRDGPTFRLSNDAALLRQASEATSCKKTP